MLFDQETIILIREFLPSSKEPNIFIYFISGLVFGVVIVVMKFEKYKKIRELFMKLF